MHFVDKIKRQIQLVLSCFFFLYNQNNFFFLIKIIKTTLLKNRDLGLSIWNCRNWIFYNYLLWIITDSIPNHFKHAGHTAEKESTL